jgi:hypothetical protein
MVMLMTHNITTTTATTTHAGGGGGGGGRGIHKWLYQEYKGS